MLNAEIESLYGKATLKLLELASGRFSRREIFELLLNPCLRQKWGFTIEDIQILAGWSQALNIFHTFDKASKIKKGYFASDMYTWKQGLLRLKLSRIFSGPQDTLTGDESFGFIWLPFSWHDPIFGYTTPEIPNFLKNSV
jgi:exonuclease V gamma subunit